MITNSAAEITPTELGVRCHPACFACGVRNGDGLGLRFAEQPDGAVVGTFSCEGRYQGYPGRLHGGIVAMLADAAMTHCLFLRGISAVTGKLSLRFPAPVDIGREAVVRAKLIKKSPPLFKLTAEILQDEKVCVTAEALFVEQTHLSTQTPSR